MSTEGRPASDATRAAVSIGIAVVLGGLLAWALLVMHGPLLAMLARESRLVLERKPYSIALQSRLLMPVLVWLSSQIASVDFATSYSAWLVLLSLADVVVPTVAVRAWSGSWNTGVRYGAAQAAAIILMQDRVWLHLWDLADVVIGTIFAYAIFADKKIEWFVVLFVVALTNRESALFIPLWLVISALPDRANGKPRFDVPRLLVGSLGISLGLLAISKTRTLLYAGAAPLPRYRLTFWGNHSKLHSNYSYFW